ncbi:MAG: hypothetical protein IPJ03_16190 [Ignavibacteriales bacterium]|nr:hypothetical protein [Ignavibacteriales bacterium]
MAEIKFITPFAEVKILIDKKDEWAKKEIEDWICHKCGVPSGSDIRRILTKFERNTKQKEKENGFNRNTRF